MIGALIEAFPWLNKGLLTIAVDASGPLLSGLLKFTLPLTLISFVLGFIIALAVALIRIVPTTQWWLKLLLTIARVYLSIVRGTPMLSQLFVIFYALPNIGITLEPMPTAIIAFSLNTGAYTSEVLRGAILSIPKSQWEAGYTIGMSYRQNFIRVVFPQAIRVALPSLSNNFISLVKDTSLASVVLVPEIMRQANIIASTTYEFLLIYVEVAFFYWVVCFALSLLQKRLESRYDRYIA